MNTVSIRSLSGAEKKRLHTYLRRENPLYLKALRTQIQPLLNEFPGAALSLPRTLIQDALGASK